MDKKDVPPTKNTAFDYLMKVIIIGDSGVGKTNILLRYSEDRFAENYLMTLGINYLYRIEQVDGIRIKIQIWDTAGQDKYKTITKSYYNGSNGVVLVYSVDCRLSFIAIKSWITDLKQKVKADCQVILVGNKSDIVEDSRQVSVEEGKQLAESLGVAFFECSAKTGDNVHFTFKNLAAKLKSNIIDSLAAETVTPDGNNSITIGGQKPKTDFKYQISKGKKRKPCNC